MAAMVLLERPVRVPVTRLRPGHELDGSLEQQTVIDGGVVVDQVSLPAVVKSTEVIWAPDGRGQLLRVWWTVGGHGDYPVDAEVPLRTGGVR